MASSLYDPEQPLATLSQLLKSFELLKSLGRANEGNSSIEYVSVGVEGEVLGTIQKKTRKRGSIRQVESRKGVNNGSLEQCPMSSEPITPKKKMLSRFIALGACACGVGAIGKVVIFTMISEIT